MKFNLDDERVLNDVCSMDQYPLLKHITVVMTYLLYQVF